MSVTPGFIWCVLALALSGEPNDSAGLGLISLGAITSFFVNVVMVVRRPLSLGDRLDIVILGVLATGAACLMAVVLVSLVGLTTCGNSRTCPLGSVP